MSRSSNAHFGDQHQDARGVSELQTAPTSCVGLHAENWDAIEIDGKLGARDCVVTYKQGARRLAVATISRDLQSLQTETAMESEVAAAALTQPLPARETGSVISRGGWIYGKTD